MSIRHCSSGLAVLLLATTGLRAQDTARAVIEKAVQAHGGSERLNRVRADHVKLKGSLFVEGKETPFVAETMVQLPAQCKILTQVTTPTRVVAMVQILNGDKAFVSIDGQPQKVEAAALAEMHAAFQLNRAIRLTPLLTDRAYELTLLGDSKVNDRPAIGIKVLVKATRREMRLYFDKATGLLAKTEQNLETAEGKAVKQEVYYGDFRDLGGYKRPVKLMALRDGKKVMEAELTDVKYLDKIDEAEFTKP